MAWTPPADKVTTDTGWRPPADKVQTNPDDNRRWDQKLSEGIETVVSNIDNPGRMLGNEMPQVNAMGPQGDALFNKAGEAVTDYLGRQTQIPGVSNPYVAAAAGTAVSLANPQNWMSPAPAPGKVSLPGRAAFQESAQEAGRKALGYTKAYLNKKPGNLEKANAVAQTMLDQGVISPFAGTSTMIERNQMLMDTAGQSMGENINTLSKSGNKSFTGADVNREIESQLAPKYEGGAYDAERKIVQEITDTVRAHGEGPLDFSSAQELKEKLKELGRFNTNTDAVKSKLYQRASGIVREALDRSVDAAGSAKNLPVVQPGAKTGEPHAVFSYNDQFGPEGSTRSQYTVFGDPSHPVFQKKSPSGAGGHGSTMTKADLDALGIKVAGREPRSVGKWEPLEDVGFVDSELSKAAADYGVNKNLYGKAMQAEKALRNRYSSEGGNKNIGLTDTIVAGAELAHGNIGHALVAVGVKKAFERGYHAMKASAADTLAKETLSPLQQKAMGTTASGTGQLSESRRREFYSKYVDRFIVGKH